jgi:hypothetical protein
MHEDVPPNCHSTPPTSSLSFHILTIPPLSPFQWKSLLQVRFLSGFDQACPLRSLRLSALASCFLSVPWSVSLTSPLPPMTLTARPHVTSLLPAPKRSHPNYKPSARCMSVCPPQLLRCGRPMSPGCQAAELTFARFIWESLGLTAVLNDKQVSHWSFSKRSTGESVRVVRALSSESDSVTHSASPRARTALASSATAACDDNATNLPSSSLHPHRSPRPSSSSSSLVSPLSSFADRKPPLASKHVKRRPCSLVCAISARHDSSCQPRVMHVVLDTSLVVPRSRTQVSLGHLAVYGHIRSPSVCFLSPSLS